MSTVNARSLEGPKVSQREFFDDLIFTTTSGKKSVRSADKGNENNALQATTTSVTTAATQITFPDEGTKFKIYHTSAGDLWLGPNSSITAGGSTAAPLAPFTFLDVVVPEGNDNGIYGITDSGTISVYVVGAANL